MKVVVIGSGIGGLATALRLKKMGLEVVVFESNSFPGGKINSKWLGKYRFDMGPSVFTEPDLMNELLQMAGRENFPFRQLKESCRYFYADGFSATLPVNQQELVEVFTAQFGESEKSIRRYLNRVKKNYEAVKPVFIEISLHRPKHLFNLKLLSAIRRIPFYGLIHTMNEHNVHHFKNPKTVQLFNRFATYNGSSPFKSPGMLNIISHLELNVGPAMPVGGMVEITKQTYEACKNMGVQFHFSEKVNEIRVTQNRVSGVATDLNTYDADIVVSNMDIHFTYERLLPTVKAPSNILNQEKSSSALVFYWGVKTKVEKLGVHNTIFSEDYSEEFECLFTKKILTDDPTIYIHITSKEEKGDAPHYGENWFVMVNAPIDEGQDWDEIRIRTRKNIIHQVNKILKINMEDYIEEEDFSDPRKIEQQYFGKQGSIYGNSSNSSFSAFYRHPNFSKQLKGLYFAGVTVHPGGGIPLALNSAKIIERCVREDYKLG
ncbi:MAG: NAD(P)/FAD-dependent oxidoreductase [Bacteroidetes bacterium]|nr:NAD(P)/FAD-dependent oxidoreductase [Bacteroidota bacterium]